MHRVPTSPDMIIVMLQVKSIKLRYNDGAI